MGVRIAGIMNTYTNTQTNNKKKKRTNSKQQYAMGCKYAKQTTEKNDSNHGYMKFIPLLLATSFNHLYIDEAILSAVAEDKDDVECKEDEILLLHFCGALPLAITLSVADVYTKKRLKTVMGNEASNTM